MERSGTATIKRIKLCIIEPGNTNDPISCRLTPATLDHQLDYRCLSYVWGPSHDATAILLDGQDHEARRNLHAALQQLRNDGFDTSIWIDALCIDQENNGEKQEQVAMMGDIFRQAEEAIVWLGEVKVPDPRHGLIHGGTKYVKSGSVPSPVVDECISSLAKDSHFHDLPFRSHCMSRKCPATLGGLTEHEHHWPDVLAAMLQWFDISWFERAWTVQKIVLASRATLVLGPYSLPWDTVAEAWVNLGRHMRTCCTECMSGLRGDEPEHLYRMASHIIDLAAAKTKLEEGQHLVESLLQFSWKQTTNPRDKLYGLLGLQSGARPTPVVPDYTASLQTIFTGFAADVVRTQGWLMPLCLDLGQHLAGLPSWVPDWAVPPRNPSFYTVSRVGPDFALEVDGQRFDAIRRLALPYELTNSLADQLTVLQSWIDLLALHSARDGDYIAGGNLQEAFWRTMYGDRFQGDEKTRQTQPDDIHNLQAFLQEAQDKLAEFGDDAIIGLDASMPSHVIAVLDRRLFETNDGWIGICPKAAEVGDDIFVLGDCPVPVVLRRKAEGGRGWPEYAAVGHCYLHGIMYGEAADKALQTSRIHIV